MNLDDAEESPSELMVEIESTVDGVLFTGSPDSAGVYMESRYLSPGQHVLSITITDSGGANISRSMSILVKTRQRSTYLSVCQSSPRYQCTRRQRD